MNRLILGYVFLFFTILSLNSCQYVFDIIDLADKAKDQYIETTSVDEAINFEEDFEWTSTVDGFGLMLPIYLRPKHEMEDMFSLFHADVENQIEMAGLKQPKNEIIKDLESHESYEDSLSVIQNYAQLVLNNYKDYIGLERVVKQKSTQLRGLNLEIIELVSPKHSEISIDKIGCTVAVLEGENFFYTLIYLCKGIEYEKYRISFEKSISTFREL
jgi:hypothetical protein